jgi:hypothetical protein
MIMSFNSVPFKIQNDTGSFSINHTVYDMECNAFELPQQDDYPLVLIHHFFKSGNLKVSKLINPVPQDIKDVATFLEINDNYMPLLFNRSETNQQYFNLTLSANLDNIPILSNE